MGKIVTADDLARTVLVRRSSEGIRVVGEPTMDIQLIGPRQADLVVDGDMPPVLLNETVQSGNLKSHLLERKPSNADRVRSIQQKYIETASRHQGIGRPISGAKGGANSQLERPRDRDIRLHKDKLKDEMNHSQQLLADPTGELMLANVD